MLDSSGIRESIESSTPSLPFHRRLGRISFDDALAIQERIIDQFRATGKGLPVILSLEHEHVVTCGRSTDTSNLLLSWEEYQKRGIEVRFIDRGGDVTYHGPGQVVVYPLVSIRSLNLRAGEYIRCLEECMIRMCADWGVKSFRRERYPGCWTDEGKIGAVGASIKSGGITKHGLSFNVTTDLSFFDLIVPCGITKYRMVRLADLADRQVDIEDVEMRLVLHLANILGLEG
jgi:lipoyl(octanoyl) transferase